MVDFPSDVSSTGSAQYRPTHITFETPNHDPEKPAFHNGLAYAEERTHSKTDKDEEEDENLDMLIEELESLDPDEQVEAELDAVGGGGRMDVENMSSNLLWRLKTLGA